ncbi:probable cytochrome P450 305a1 [Phlebotomus argentipes]|uniref:probable cytochrome P450 305a1 n=1 Tax=Phlebotomus argentipes TaxID=94469 RepID=UPI002892D0A4|nr:probable cytochrome P450 305a1 [Phlebotomus argentipes]
MSLIFFQCVFIILLVIYYYCAQKRPRNFPPGPSWLPIFGNSIQLRRAARKLNGAHNVYQKWSEEYNNSEVVGFRLGGKYFITALSEKAVKDVYARRVFEGRPRNFFVTLRSFNTYAGITMADGDLWREHRSFTLKRLKSVGFGDGPMQQKIEMELQSCKKLINKKMKEEGSMWPGEFLALFVMNVLWTFAAGSEYPYEKSKHIFQLLNVRMKAFDFSGGILSDVPWLRFIAPEFSGYNLMLRFNEEIRSFLQNIIDDHHRNFSEDKANEDFIYAFISEIQKGRPNYTDAYLMIIMVDLFLGGAHTTSITLDLALMTLALYEDIQEQVYEEVKRAKEDFMKIAEHRSFPYTEAYLLEIARFYNVVPLSGPRRTLDDTELCGYNIPKNTTVLIGNQSVHMNKELWGDPEIFRPSRFLDESGTKLCNSEKVLQFGEGRRLCLGISLAKAFLFTFLTGIVRDYKLSVAKKGRVPDQTLSPGILKTAKPAYISSSPYEYFPGAFVAHLCRGWKFTSDKIVGGCRFLPAGGCAAGGKSDKTKIEPSLDEFSLLNFSASFARRPAVKMKIVCAGG